jgi:hypothetical protein
MEQSEIVRRNEAIARFMGLSCPPTYDGPNSIGRGYYDPNDLQYHSEWQWIMPAMEQILITNKECCDFLCRPSFLNKKGVKEEKVSARTRFSASVPGVRGPVKYFNGVSSTSLIESVFIAVSDYCLSLEPSPGAGV